MFGRFYRFSIITIGTIGWWHGRRGYPQQRHGIAVALHRAPMTTSHRASTDASPDSVTPFTAQGAARHG
jgi:hypothetical protein